MVPQSDSPPKPLGATVPHSSLCRWNWAQKLKPLPLHSSEALDAYFWVRGFLGVDQHDHQKKSKILKNRLNRLAGYENHKVLRSLIVLSEANATMKANQHAYRQYNMESYHHQVSKALSAAAVIAWLVYGLGILRGIWLVMAASKRSATMLMVWIVLNGIVIGIILLLILLDEVPISIQSLLLCI